MAITDYTITGVRLRTDDLFTHTPNRVIAGQGLAEGQFVLISAEGKFLRVEGEDERATHCVIKSGQMRHDPDELALVGLVEEGEPVMAFTGGPGIVRLPVASSVEKGQDLTVFEGYAVAWREDTNHEGAYIVGKALEDADGSADELEWIDCFINLPAQFQSQVTS